MQRSFRYFARIMLAGAALALGQIGAATAVSPTIKFAEPSWPGVSIKTEVVSQLLETLGYQVKTTRLNLPFVYRGLENGSADVFMGAWLPSNRDMLEPPVKKGKIIKLALNLHGAVLGLAVPDYVWKKGIHSIKDIVAHGKMFDHKIYAIASGSAMNQAFDAAIKSNYEGLSGWRVVPSSTAVMLAQVKRSTQQKKPIVFYAWRPHWMNVRFNIHYLQDKPDSPIANIKSQVYTVVTAGFPKQHPNAARFLRQVSVEAKTQSEWINQYSQEKKSKRDVARAWLKTHQPIVLKWLAGVKTVSGDSAAAAYRKQF